MDPQVRAAKLDAVYDFIRTQAAPASSYLIGSRVLDLRLRDKRHMRRAVRTLLSTDERFQEVHAGLWEALDAAYGRQRLEEARFGVLDLEVTGSDPEHNSAIDVGVFEVHGNRVRPLFSTLVDPGIPIPRSIHRLTGIDDEMVRDAPRFEDVLPKLHALFEDRIFVAHNVSFDYHFLKTWLERIGGRPFTVPHICTVKLSHRLLDPGSGSRKLHHLARHFGIPLENRHRARDDAYATARILVELKKLLAKRDIHTVGAMKRFESGVIPGDGARPRAASAATAASSPGRSARGDGASRKAPRATAGGPETRTAASGGNGRKPSPAGSPPSRPSRRSSSSSSS